MRDWRTAIPAISAARRRPALGLFLAALFLAPFQWLSPFSYPQAGLTDVFIAVALVAWLAERVRAPGPIARLRAIHLAYAAFAACTVLSAAAAADRGLGAQNVVITCELIALGMMASSFWCVPAGRRAISAVVVATVVVTALEAIVALALFYLGQKTSLASSYSGYFKASRLYTRVAAGFASAPLMGSYCIFASAVIARDVLQLPRRVRWVLQGTLAVLTLITLSRAFFGFALAVAIRSRRAGARRVRVASSAAAGACVVLTIALTLVPLSADPFRPASSKVDINPRLATLKSSAETWADHPLLGKGPGSLTAKWQGRRLRAHFTPVNVAATTGLPALMSLGAGVVILWRRRRRATSMSVWSGLAGLGLDALGQDVEHFRHVWLMLGIADAEREEIDD